MDETPSEEVKRFPATEFDPSYVIILNHGCPHGRRAAIVIDRELDEEKGLDASGPSIRCGRDFERIHSTNIRSIHQTRNIATMAPAM